MNSPKKGMTTAQASRKKLAGHEIETHYADMIGGEVSRGSKIGKKDVIDYNHGTHSVKSGKKWQIFLYSKSRLKKNTVFNGFGEIPGIMLKCIETLPNTREEREKNPRKYKIALKDPMERLCQELQDKRLLDAFILKAFFEAGEVDYFAILPRDIDQTTSKKRDLKFRVFDAKEVGKVLCKDMIVENSKARQSGQMNSQKVIFRQKFQKKTKKGMVERYNNIGEIELRTDPSNFGKLKMWFDAKKVLDFLTGKIEYEDEAFDNVHVYGNAKRLIKSARS